MYHLPSQLPARSIYFFSTWGELSKWSWRGQWREMIQKRQQEGNNLMCVQSCFSCGLLVRMPSVASSIQNSAFPVSRPAPCPLDHCQHYSQVLVSGVAVGLLPCAVPSNLLSLQGWRSHGRLCLCSLLTYYSLKFN